MILQFSEAGNLVTWCNKEPDHFYLVSVSPSRDQRLSLWGHRENHWRRNRCVHRPH